MDLDRLSGLLEAIRGGEVSVEEGLQRLRDLPYEDLGFARVDNHRVLRQGQPEVIYGEGKTPEQICRIFSVLIEKNARALATRITPEAAEEIQIQMTGLKYDPVSRLLWYPSQLPRTSTLPEENYAVVLSAGTSDMRVAEEAAQTLDYYGATVKRIYDVGVAGIHRLLDHRDSLFHAKVIISVAGMEGALTSVVSGLVSCPVIGVPTSVGYGASFEGLAALLTMLNSCASGVAVVNIDNGFGAAVLAYKILHQLSEEVV
ncbi:MAG: 1-(5-phosphoribosyl)-5-amino-4-imidazole-carboxylate carboxylase [Chloroflexi bacterium RBG_16_48_8]|nr:MAG: 1-(5-phosphoribosyl)-5-amino-4-imidazole-carboxylate carboxylase [Chloroflexi bacterium RBG_16_48_8]